MTKKKSTKVYHSYATAGELLNTASKWGMGNLNDDQTALVSGLASTAGNALSGIGQNKSLYGDIVGGIGDVAMGINPLIGAALKANAFAVNSLFGSNIDTQAVDAYKNQIQNAGNLAAGASDYNQLAAGIQANNNINIDPNNLGTQGIFSNALDKQAAQLEQQKAFNNAAIRNSANNINLSLGRGLQANALAEGGKIHIKPENRGKFTASAKRAGMGVQEFASHVLANKEDYSPLMRKRANFARNAAHWNADGGLMDNTFTNGVTMINNGDTHENNPYGGVQVGIAPDGIPNQVEEGEVIVKIGDSDYVFSNRELVKDDKEGNLLEKYKLPKDITYAQASKKLQKESAERPNDPISKRGLDVMMNDLMQSQERVRAAQQAKQVKRELNKLSDEELLALQDIMQGVPQQQDTLMSPYDQSMQQPMYANGGIMGHKFETGSFVTSGDRYRAERHRPLGPMMTPGGGRPTTPLYGNRALRGSAYMTPEERQVAAAEAKRIRTSRVEAGNRVDTLISNLEDVGARIPSRYYIRQIIKNNPNLTNTQLVSKYFPRSSAAYMEKYSTEVPDTPAYRDFNSYVNNPDLPFSVENRYSVRPDEYAINPTEVEAMRATQQLPTELPEVTVTPKANVAGVSSINSTEPSLGIANTNLTRTSGYTATSAPTSDLSEATATEEALPTNIALSENVSSDINKANQGYYQANKEGTFNQPKEYDTWMRYAPVVGAGIGAITSLFDRPDYSGAKRVEEAARITPPTIQPHTIGDYLQYNPFDRDYYTNQLAATAAAGRRGIANTSNIGTRLAGTLASDYNAMLGEGNLARQSDEYNLAQRQQVGQFNRGTNQFNAQQLTNADLANANMAMQAAQSNLQGTIYGEQMRNAERNALAQMRSANLTNLFDNLGDIGRENLNINQANFNRAVGYGTGLTGKSYYKAQNYAYDPITGEKLTYANGGMLTKKNIKKRRK